MAATKTKPKRKSENVTHLEILEAAEALATPIDFDQLIADGDPEGWRRVVRSPGSQPDARSCLAEDQGGQVGQSRPVPQIE